MAATAPSPASPQITDPVFTPRESPSAWHRFWLKHVREERDLPFVDLTVAYSLVMIPFAVALFVPGVFTWWLAPIYWGALFGLFFDRYILMLHNTSHRPLFHKGKQWAQKWIVWVLGPLNGETPETYFAHHIGMHHPENNLPDDLSTTMPYQRDSLPGFLHYFLRFFFGGLFDLARYHVKRGRNRFARRAIIGELSWYAAVAGLCLLDWRATLVVLVIPMVLCRFLMMAGNWAQHAFIDPTDPANPLRNSITCINTRYNRRCFNDGYHIGHHEKATRHWTDMPVDFQNKLEAYRDQGAVVFEGIDYFQIWAMLMLRRHTWLAERMVDLGKPYTGEPRTLDERVAFLKERLVPVPREAVA